MRPPEFTGGNTGRPHHPVPPATRRGFNEAAGIHRRKPRKQALAPWTAGSASMRPPEFTGGNSSTVPSYTKERGTLQ